MSKESVQQTANSSAIAGFDNDHKIAVRHHVRVPKFQKNTCRNPYISKNILPEESLRLCFSLTFNIIISYIFLRNFVEIHQISQNM